MAETLLDHLGVLALLPQDSGPPYLAIGLAGLAGAGIALGGFMLFRKGR